MNFTKWIDKFVFYKTKHLYIGEVENINFVIHKYINPMFPTTQIESKPYNPPQIIMAYRKKEDYQEIFTKRKYQSKNTGIRNIILNEYHDFEKKVYMELFNPQRYVKSDFNCKYISREKVKKYIHFQQEKTIKGRQNES